MKQPFWLGIDCGGTYLKAGLYDQQGREFAIQRQALVTVGEKPGWAERDMPGLWQTCADTIATLLTRCAISGNQVKGIGISAQGKGLFLLDKNDQPLGPAMLLPTGAR